MRAYLCENLNHHDWIRTLPSPMQNARVACRARRTDRRVESSVLRSVDFERKIAVTQNSIYTWED